MKKYIVLRCVLLCLVVVLISGAISAVTLHYSKQKDIVNNMQDLLTVILKVPRPANGNYEKLTEQYKDLTLNYRITVLDISGKVLGDTLFDGESMQNHAHRPEIVQALATGKGYEERYSTTYKRKMLYVAKRDGNLIYRIAAPVESINATFFQLIPALIAGLLLALLISPFLAMKTAKSIIRPLSDVAASLKPLGEGNYDVKVISPPFHELRPITDTINSLTHQISKSMRKLSEQKEKTEYLLNSMADGLILVDDQMKVRQINASARRILDENKSTEGENLLFFTHRKQLVDAVNDAVKSGTSTLFDFEEEEMPGVILSAHVTAIRSDWITGKEANGASVLITNVTQERKAEQMRSDFVANASHELKTPITSIGGFAELLSAGMVSDPKKQKEYLTRIQKETQRMSALIDDILKLSRLETGEEKEKERQKVAFRPLIEDTLADLSPQIQEKNLSVDCDADESTLYAVLNDVRMLVGNLIDNAVKYNKQEGNIRILLKRENDRIRFSVSDTGIGIPLEHQARIFERFYRVDKGRSRMAGGTGLGLSIVKHVAVKYGGEISLKSAEGKGTVITVLFPIK